MATTTAGKAGAERRRHRRVDRNIPLDMHLDALGYDIRGETQNISAVGTYCAIDRPLPEMTRLMLALKLPSGPVTCEGTVVRSQADPDNTDRHHVAIFFSDISKTAQTKLSEFLSA